MATLAALVLEGVAGGYSHKLGFSVKDTRDSRLRFKFRVGGGFG